jgi:hypothetical protein
MRYVSAIGRILAPCIGLCLVACSDVGPGFKNHPVDCAVGFAWADCLPGTAGYNNGGGSETRKLEMQKETAELEVNQKAAQAQCESDLQTSDLDPIRAKIQFWRKPDDPVPFDIAVNNDFPSEVERGAIAKWASLREACSARMDRANQVPAGATPAQAAFFQQEWAFVKDASNKVGELVVALYQGKMAYGEFAQNRYKVGQAAADAEREYRASVAIADEQRQMEARRLAQQQFANQLAAWGTYMQAVNARPIVTAPVHCTSSVIGNFVNTNCY